MTAKARKKNNKKDGLAAMRELLNQHRETALSLYEHDLRAGQQSSDDGAEDIVDKANNAYNREFLLLLSGNERDVVRQIEEALVRLDDGTFGSCENCEVEIAEKRLQALPWARYCVDCQERLERGLLEED
jgi:DnaK suppressor protein